MYRSFLHNSLIKEIFITFWGSAKWSINGNDRFARRIQHEIFTHNRTVHLLLGIDQVMQRSGPVSCALPNLPY